MSVAGHRALPGGKGVGTTQGVTYIYIYTYKSSTYNIYIYIYLSKLFVYLSIYLSVFLCVFCSLCSSGSVLVISSVCLPFSGIVGALVFFGGRGLGKRDRAGREREEGQQGSLGLERSSPFGQEWAQ